MIYLLITSNSLKFFNKNKAINVTNIYLQLVARLTSSLCGLIDHQLISDKNSQNEKYALKLKLTLVPDISNACSENLENLSTKSKNQVKRCLLFK